MDSQNSSACVISLNALDLNFLKDRFDQNFGTSYWAKKNLPNEKFYYEFEVKTDESLDINEESTNYEEEIEYIPCHICEIKVPEQFYYEHRNSVKHEINVKIANLAVQRLQKHITYYHEISSNAQNSSVDFCPVCAITMNSTEKISHENSIGHRNSVIVEKFLKDFLIIYSNKAYEDNENAKCNMSTAITETNKSTIKSTDCDIQENLKEMSVNKEPSDELSVIKVPVVENKPNYTGLCDYVTLLKEKYKTEAMQFNVIDELTIEITTVDKSILRVDAESFYGLNKLSRRFTQCIICKEVFNTSFRQQHMFNEYHMKLVWCSTLKNKDCIRYISDSWNHCMLCNEGVEDSSLHISSNAHLVNVKVSLISENKLNNNKVIAQPDNVHYSSATPMKDENSSAINTSKTETADTKRDKLPALPTQSAASTDVDRKLSTEAKNENVYEKQFCSHCNIYISNKGFKKHSNTVKHYMNTLSDLHYFMNAIASVEADEFVCRVCDENVANNNDDIKQHTTTPKHLQNYNDLLQKNCIRRLNKQTFFCTPCYDIILIKNELLHINSKEHKELCGEEDDETVDKCLDTVTSTVEVKTSEARSESPSFFCNICVVNVPNSKHNIETHIKGRPHIRNVQKLFNCKKELNVQKADQKESKKDNINDENKDQANNALPKSQTETPTMRYYLEKTTDVSMLKCIVCDVFITNNEVNIATHIKGLNHSNSYNIIVERNGLEINDNDVFCKICSVHISIGNEISHCKGKKHMGNMSPPESS